MRTLTDGQFRAGEPCDSAYVDANALEFVYDRLLVYEKELLGW